MGEPAIPTDRERDARRALAIAIVESVRNDERMPLETFLVEHYLKPSERPAFLRSEVETLVFQLAQEIAMLLQDEEVQVSKLAEELPVVMSRTAIVTMSTREIRRIYELGMRNAATAGAPGSRPKIAAIMTGTTAVRPDPAPSCANCMHPVAAPCHRSPPTDQDCCCAGYRWDPPPPNSAAARRRRGLRSCSVHSLPGHGPEDLARIVSVAMQVGAHWRAQEGVNAALLDELADATADPAVLARSNDGQLWRSQENRDD